METLFLIIDGATKSQVLSRRSKVLGVALTPALVLGLLVPLTYPNLHRLFASLFYYLVIIPAIFLKLFRHGGGKQQYRRQGRDPHNQFAPSNRYQNSRVIPQTTRDGEVIRNGGERMIADFLHKAPNCQKTICQLFSADY